MRYFCWCCCYDVVVVVDDVVAVVVDVVAVVVDVAVAVADLPSTYVSDAQ